MRRHVTDLHVEDERDGQPAEGVQHRLLLGQAAVLGARRRIGTPDQHRHGVVEPARVATGGAGSGRSRTRRPRRPRRRPRGRRAPHRTPGRRRTASRRCRPSSRCTLRSRCRVRRGCRRRQTPAALAHDLPVGGASVVERVPVATSPLSSCDLPVRGREVGPVGEPGRRLVGVSTKLSPCSGGQPGPQRQRHHPGRGVGVADDPGRVGLGDGRVVEPVEQVEGRAASPQGGTIARIAGSISTPISSAARCHPWAPRPNGPHSCTRRPPRRTRARAATHREVDPRPRARPDTGRGRGDADPVTWRRGASGSAAASCDPTRARSATAIGNPIRRGCRIPHEPFVEFVRHHHDARTRGTAMWDTVQTMHSAPDARPAVPRVRARRAHLPPLRRRAATARPRSCRAGRRASPDGASPPEPRAQATRPIAAEQVGVADDVLGRTHAVLAALDRRAATRSDGPRTPRSSDAAHRLRSHSASATGTRPDPVVRPRDRRGDQHRQRRQAGAEHPVAPPPPRGADEQGRERERPGDREPEQRRRRAVEQPGERAVHRLVVGQRRRPDPARVDEAVGPVRAAASPASRRTRPRPWPRRPAAARPAAVRRPTSTSSTTNTSGVSFTPAAIPTRTPDQRRSGREQVDQHRQHQEQVDLSEGEVLPHRLEGERTGSHERDQPARRGRPSARRRPRRPPPGPRPTPRSTARPPARPAAGQRHHRRPPRTAGR